MPLTDKSKVTNHTISQLDGATQTVGSQTPTVTLLDPFGNIRYSEDTTVPTINTPGYSKNALFSKTNAGAGVPGLYMNIGTNLLCNFVLIAGGGVLPNDTLAYNLDATGGAVVQSAAKMVDAILDRDGGATNRTDTTTTAALLVAAISGAVVGSAFYFWVRNVSATPGQTMTLAAGAGVTLSGNVVIVAGENQLYIGRVTNATGGAEAVTLYAQPGVAGALGQSITASTVNTALLTTAATGNNVALSMVGSDASIGFTVTPKLNGTLVLGNTAGTGQITVGSSSVAQTVVIGNGAGTPTVSIANAAVGAAQVNIACANTAGGITSTVNIETGDAADTAIKQVNILVGSPQTGGNNRCVVGGPGVNTRMTINADLCHSRTPNWISSETGANNAIAGALLDANGVAVPEIGGTRVTVLLGHTIQGAAGGGSTFDFNGNGAVAIKSHRDLTADIVVGYAVGAAIDLMRVGSVWADMSQ